MLQRNKKQLYPHLYSGDSSQHCFNGDKNALAKLMSYSRDFVVKFWKDAAHDVINIMFRSKMRYSLFVDKHYNQFLHTK